MLAKVPSPFMLPCDFAHQLGREGPRKPLQPAWKKRDRDLSGARAGHRSKGKEAPWGLMLEGHSECRN